ncbi:hypothetical protein GW777_06300 [Candidatus Peregrinibacteria bacterium]|nr:hypothetical protein [Candidatus Peregrinibacteria bacterium]
MGKLVNGLIAFLVVLSVTVIPLHYLGLEFINLNQNLIIFDKLVVTIFTIEYFLRLWSADKPLKYFISWWGLVDLAAIAPFYLHELGLINNPEIFMLLRILRLFKLGQIFEAERTAIRRSSRGNETHGGFTAFKGECILHVAQKHWIVFLIPLIFCLMITSVALLVLIFLTPISTLFGIAIGVMLLLLSGLMFTKLWLDFNYDLIYITDKRLIWQERELFGAITNEVSYAAISNVKPNDTSFWHWLFKYGDIEIETAAEKGSLIFKSARKPRAAVEFISQQRLQNSGSVRQGQIGVTN